MFQIVGATEKGIEKAHELHAAEAQLKNTMQNMGTYSEGTYEKIISGSKKLASGINFSSSEVIGLQSQIRMMGNIGDSEMQRLTMASADMATKFGMDINEAGQTLAKAVNNPEMMQRLGQGHIPGLDGDAGFEKMVIEGLQGRVGEDHGQCRRQHQDHASRRVMI